jgi:hypothetical protein
MRRIVCGPFGNTLPASRGPTAGIWAPIQEAKGSQISTTPLCPGASRGFAPDPISKKKKEKSVRKDFFLNKDCEENNLLNSYQDSGRNDLNHLAMG